MFHCVTSSSSRAPCSSCFSEGRQKGVSGERIGFNFAQSRLVHRAWQECIRWVTSGREGERSGILHASPGEIFPGGFHASPKIRWGKKSRIWPRQLASFPKARGIEEASGTCTYIRTVLVRRIRTILGDGAIPFIGCQTEFMSRPVGRLLADRTGRGEGSDYRYWLEAGVTYAYVITCTTTYLVASELIEKSESGPSSPHTSGLVIDRETMSIRPRSWLREEGESLVARV